VATPFKLGDCADLVLDDQDRRLLGVTVSNIDHSQRLAGAEWDLVARAPVG
jgi:hypothetical protein